MSKVSISIELVKMVRLNIVAGGESAISDVYVACYPVFNRIVDREY